MKMKFLVTPLLILISLALIVSCGNQSAQSADNVIKIATQGPLSGGQAAFGEQIKLGSQLALDDNAEKFKALGFTLELVPFDDQANPDTGVANANRIINDPAILGVVGHYNSGVAIPSSEVYARVNLVMVSPANTSPKVTDRLLPNVNRICGRDDVQGPAGAEFAVNELKAKKMFVMHDKTAYGQGIAQAFRDKAVELGADIPASSFMGTEEKSNFIPIITQIMAINPDLIYFGGIYDQIGAFTKQLRERGVKTPILSDDGLDASDYLRIAGAANTTETYYTTVAGPSDQFPKAKAAIEAFKTKFSKNAEGFGLYAYDSATVILSAIESTIQANGGKLPTREAVSAAVRQVNLDGLTGPITFDEKGDKTSAEYFILKVAGTDSWSDNKVFKTLTVAAPKAPAASN